MKRIELKKLPGEAAEIAPLEYRTMLREVVRRPLDPKQGADITEMRQSIRVLDAIDAANGAVELEDADYDHLKQKLQAMPWAVVDRRILRFVDDVMAADDGLRS